MSSVDDINLTVVSNRLPFVLVEDAGGKWTRKSSAGGLVTALAPVVNKTGGCWVGWPGVPAEKLKGPLPEAAADDKSPVAGLKSEQVKTVNIAEEDVDNFYTNVCNATLWPLFHSMPDRATFSHSAFKAYRKVNKCFAASALQAERKKQGDLINVIWIHDYQLLLTPKYIRDQLSSADRHILAFFLHIPFPGYDIFQILPWAEELLKGMLGCDLIAFHDDDHTFNFLDCCQRFLGLEVNKKAKTVECIDGRIVQVQSLPISIPYKKFVKLAQEAPRAEMERKAKIILGVDRLDYTKGLPHRLDAYELLLKEHPEFIGKVQLVQVAVPSRSDVPEYEELREEVEGMVGAINGRYATDTWTPIQFFCKGLSQVELAAMYRDAEIALVTSLRDGMNLVAKEFVACRVKEPGVLVLSKFAGAGKLMQEALLVNPFDVEDVANALFRALNMSEEERMRRMEGLQAREKKSDVDVWMNSFLESIVSFINSRDIKFSKSYLDFQCRYMELEGLKKKLVLLLDFDGTLAPLVCHPLLSVVPDDTKELLDKLRNCPSVEMAMVSGRLTSDLKNKAGLDKVTYSGSHGNVIEFGDGTTWKADVDVEGLKKLETTLNEKLIGKQYEGAWMENKTFTLCVHFRHVHPSKVDEAMNIVFEEAKKLNINTFPGHATIECKPQGVTNKGGACLKILQHFHGSDWQRKALPVYIGDDTTDEDAMAVLKGKGGINIRIFEGLDSEDSGRDRKSSADIILKTCRSVPKILTWLLQFEFQKSD